MKNCRCRSSNGQKSGKETEWGGGLFAVLAGLMAVAALSAAVSIEAASAVARTLEGVDFPEETSLGGQKLLLNGTGLRIKRKLGINWKVYVAGLYAKAKTSDAAALIKGTEPKVLDLVFLRSLDKDTLREAWSEGFEKNCAEDCADAQKGLAKFNALMVDVKDKSRLTLKFVGDKVDVEITGKNTASGTLSEPGLNKALMAIFIGSAPPTPDLKKGLLGL